MFEDHLEVYMGRSNENKFVLSEYQFYDRFESISSALENDKIFKRFSQHVSDLRIRDSWVIRKMVARGSNLIEQPNPIYSGIESGSDTESDESSLEDSSCQNASSESYSTDSDNQAEMDHSARDGAVTPIQTNPKSDKSVETSSNPNITATESPLTAGPLLMSPNGDLQVEGFSIIPGDTVANPDSRGASDMETLLLRFKTKWSGDPAFENLKWRTREMIKLANRNILDHQIRTDRFFPAFKFKIDSEENGSVRPVGTLMVEDLVKRLCVCVGGNKNTDTRVPLYFDSLYNAISVGIISSAKDFLIPLVFLSTSFAEDLADSMHDFIRDVECLLGMTADIDAKKALREHIECVKDILGPLDNTWGTIISSVEFVRIYLDVLIHHVYLAYVLPVNVTDARLMLALHDFVGYVLEDITTLIIGNFERWKIYIKKNCIILSDLGRV